MVKHAQWLWAVRNTVSSWYPVCSFAGHRLGKHHHLGMDAPILILYGSQTGNAQDVAERLGREAQLLLFKPRVMAMDAYDVSQLPQERLLLCVASTTGQGDPPDNMKRFWRFLLRKSLPPDSLSALRFSVFGLGDSGYQAFNVTAKKLARRLEVLGGRMLLGVGLGDDQHPSGYEAALDAWSAAVWPVMRQEAGPLPSGVTVPVLSPATVMQLGQPKYQVTMLTPEQAQSMLPASSAPGGSWEAAVAAGLAFKRVAAAAAGGSVVCANLESSDRVVAAAAGTNSHAGSGDLGQSQGTPAAGADLGQGTAGPRLRFAKVVENRRITAQDHFQDTRHLVLDLGHPTVNYQPGDVLAVLPEQEDAAVDALLQRLGYAGQQWVCVRPSPASAGGHQGEGMQCVATLKQLIKGALDVSGASPRRYFFQVLAAFATTDRERERLQYFASAEGRDELYRYCKREGRTVTEVLTDFKSCQLPIERFLEACPPLNARLFSIASSCRLHPGQAHLTVALVEYKTPYKRTKKGLCSSYIAQLTPSGPSPVACWVERGTMRTPSDMSVPLIMVGPGTGVAPFRAFLQERLVVQRELQQSPSPGQGVASSTASSGSAATEAGRAAAVAPCHLYFGCRSHSADYYYGDEWKHMQEEGVLAAAPEGLVVAFSRDQGSKVYVTHKLREHGAAVWQLLQQGALVYVSGSAQKMPAQVSAAFRDIVQEHGGCGAEQATKFVRQLELTGRYFVEAWS